MQYLNLTKLLLKHKLPAYAVDRQEHNLKTFCLCTQSAYLNTNVDYVKGKAAVTPVYIIGMDCWGFGVGVWLWFRSLCENWRHYSVPARFQEFFVIVAAKKAWRYDSNVRFFSAFFFYGKLLNCKHMVYLLNSYQWRHTSYNSCSSMHMNWSELWLNVCWDDVTWRVLAQITKNQKNLSSKY